jgi:hypothetical protein
LANCEVTPEAIWPIVKLFIKRGVPYAPSAIHGPLGPIFDPVQKVNIIADCLETQFTAHDLCDSDHGPQVKVKVEALLSTFLPLMKTPLLNSDPVTSEKKYNP